MNFHRRNLNLLVALDALITDKNITRAAERLHLSQPAMSNVVARLREWLDDPLLVRGPSGYTLTPRAQELAVPLRTILGEIEGLVSARVFDPATSQRTFHIAMNDASVLLPQLLASLAKEAPGVEVKINGYSSFPEQQLAYGELDLVIGSFGEVPQGCRGEQLFEGHPVCAVRPGHPRIGNELSLTDLVNEKHVVAVADDHMYLVYARNMLARHNATLDICAHVSHFMEAALIAAQTDLIATVPNRLAQTCRSTFGLRVLPAPFDFPPFQVQQVWHERTQQAPDHQWLRERVRRLVGAA
ncbi:MULTISPECIES: LysR family transcriptional regulator [unclassified Pseudomonas]|uniref:LysR family transcriptional regulator n=1 Tax=unclassified Pseudomonas TaxID=196821 RepID=UPI000731664F|nr:MULTISPECIES: LysR family transcriptional regulator [unclassified Pseudomonas]KSW25812.1 hypothetical protein AOX63_19265 [Pseudomonas sp. ADP]OBP12329.1 hypothetical protein BAE52_04985 [Pseudomonas sp. EGD-AKN5]QOF82413.1 LysR family transcriptional regulator [Pseudomonas sp. ADPe]GLU42119.1 LysR family transcriptional regulator [Pseudomonas sp. NBRC 100443]